MSVIRLSHSRFSIRLPVRKFSTSTTTLSGHNRWSKIKHDKAKVDDVKTKQRSSLAKELTQASKSLGADPTTNNRLVALIASAKKAGFPKASVDAAIARGQGKSTGGIALENVTIEVMLPHAVAAIIECQTDSKARLLQDVREVFKLYGANMTPTSYLFERRGKIVLRTSTKLDNGTIFEQAIGAGALEVEEDDEGTTVLQTKPSETAAVGDALTTALGLQVESTEIIWIPKDNARVELPFGYGETLVKFINKLEDDPSVQGVYLNTG